MIDLAGKRLVHVTTVDMSLALLLGPQLQAFADAGMEVIGVSAPGPYVPELEASGVRHIALEHATRSASLGQDVRALFELRSLFRELRPDIVHTHNPKPGLYGRLAARMAGVPGVVNTVHGLYAAPEDSLPLRAAVYSLERAASMCSGAELIQNPEDLALLARLGVPRKKLVLLGNGIDLRQFHPPGNVSQRQSARRSLGVAPDALVVGTVGRLVWQKGFRELFETAERMATSRPDVVFVVVGSSDAEKSDSIDPENLDSVARKANLVFAGERKDMEDVYAAFDLFVLPSYREGFPRSAMEAAACGLPIVATDIRGCRQVVDDGVTGLLVPLRDTNALVSAVTHLVDDGALRSQMGIAGQQKATADFDDRVVIATTEATYRRVLDAAACSKSRWTGRSTIRPSYRSR
jgi:glycosyltransferase involved in cell wall biosynthesis